MNVRSTLIRVAALCAVLSSAALAQESRALFDAAVVVADHRSRFEALIDFDDDGYMDALDWWWDGYDEESVDVRGWMNDGTGQLVETWEFTIDFPFSTQSAPSNSATVGDWNGDGVKDFALAFHDHVYLYTSNGAQLPTLLDDIEFAASGGIDSLVAADFNLDGFDDFAWSDTWTTVMLNDQDGTFTAAEPAWNTTDVNGVRHVVGDVNDDGYPDLLNVRLPSLTIWYLVDGQVQSSEGFFGDIGLDEEITPVVGDIDGDLDTDVVMFNPINGEYAVIRNRGATLEIEAPRIGGPATNFFDIDGDGDLDGLCCGGGCCVTNDNNQLSKFEIAINDGTGLFAPSWSIESVGSHHLAGVADLDHDGDWDLVGGRSVYYGDGVFDGPPMRVLSDLGLPEVTEGIEAAWLCDADLDGDQDLRFGMFDQFESSADGAWAERDTVFDPQGEGGAWFGPGHPGDWDGDGDVDLIVTRQPFRNEGRNSHVLWNNGSGVLTYGQPATLPGFFLSPATQVSELDEPSAGVNGDLDGDGDLDLVVLRDTYFGGSARLWLNDGTGLFTHLFDVPGRVHHIGNLNGDSLPDLVTEEYFPPEDEVHLRVKYGLGGGAFSPGTWIPVAHSGTSRLVVTDVDGDGWDDIVARREDSTITVAVFNSGTGVWTVDEDEFLPWYSYSGGMQRVLLGDVDADGHEDLLVTNVRHAGNATYVHLKKPGQPGYEDPLVLQVTPTALDDVDGDGDLDLFVKLPGQDGADGLVLNRTFDVPEDGLRQQYGQGAAGTGGAVPTFGATGPFRVGETVQLHLNGMPGGAIGLIGLGLAPSDIPDFPRMGMTAYSWPWLADVLLVSPPADPGVPAGSRLTLSFEITQDMADVGPIYHQVFWQDAGHPFGATASQGLLIDYR